ncbi:sulfatase [Acidobacteriota bacterium]
MIHGDEHRQECLGVYGNPDIRTPNIDALAAEGERFTNSFCPYPVCTPSRYSLLSGLYVHQHRGWSNHSTLEPGIETFPSILRDSGYKTKAVGKMHFTPTYLDVGFDEMTLAEQNGPGRWDDDYHRELRSLGLVDFNDLEDQIGEYRKTARNEYWDTFGALPSNLPEKYHSTTWIADHAVRTLEGWGDTGNIMMVGFIKPHHPFDPPENWKNMYDPEKLTLLPGWTETPLQRDLDLNAGYFRHEDLTEKTLRRIMAYYYATISQIDFHVGRMVNVLKRKNLHDNTLIIYTSDHGDFMGFHHLMLKGGNMYDPVMKVPLIIKYPFNQKKGNINDSLVNNVDLAPTILGQARCRPRGKMSGFDLSKGKIDRKFIFAHGGKGNTAMARSKTKKLIHARNRRSLFLNLEEDPYEMIDLYDSPQYQEEIQKFKSAISDWEGPHELPETYLDLNAPTIRQPNVPPSDLSHRKKTIGYFNKKMSSQILSKKNTTAPSNP